MNKQFEKHLAQFRLSLAKHIVVPVQTVGPVQGYYLKDPAQGRMMSTLILFTAEGIALQGDLTPGDNGNVSALGYGLQWFSGHLSHGYLCEKFLRHSWDRDVAIEEMQDPSFWMRDDATPERIKRLDEICKGLKHEGTADWLYRELNELTDEIEVLPGTCYKPQEAALLCAIQERFSQVYYDPYLIVDLEVGGESVLFWRPNNSGYTTSFTDAGRYPLGKVSADASYYSNGDRTLAIPESFFANRAKAIVPSIPRQELVAAAFRPSKAERGES